MTTLIHCPVKQTPGQLTGEANFLCSSFRMPSRGPSERRGAKGRRKLQVEREVEHRQPRVDRLGNVEMAENDRVRLVGLGQTSKRPRREAFFPGLKLSQKPWKIDGGSISKERAPPSPPNLEHRESEMSNPASEDVEASAAAEALDARVKPSPTRTEFHAERNRGSTRLGTPRNRPRKIRARKRRARRPSEGTSRRRPP